VDRTAPSAIAAMIQAVTTVTASLGAPIWRRVARFGFDGTRYQQVEEYFLFRVRSCEVSLDGMDDVEKQTVTGYRWCSADDIESLADPVAPAALPRILRELTAPPGS